MKNANKSVREIGRLKNKKKKRILSIVILILLILLGIGLGNNAVSKMKPYREFQEVYKLEYEHSLDVKYINYLDGIVRYTKDGAVAINGDGKLLWNLPYEIQDGIVAVSGNYFAIVNRGHREINIINKKGEVRTINTNYDIYDIEIANQGVVAALMSNDNTNHIKVYDFNGKELVQKDIDIGKYGYALDIALSEDGTKLVISFMSIKTGEIETKLLFYNYSESGKDYSNRFVGGIDFENLIIPRIKFLNNNRICAFTDKGFALYSIIKTPEEILNIEFESDIKSIIYNNEHIGFVLDKSSNEGRSQIVVYNIDGTKVLDLPLDYEYDNIVFSDKEIIFNNSNSILVLNLKGRKKFEYIFENKINLVYPSKTDDRYFIINNLDIVNIKLQK